MGGAWALPPPTFIPWEDRAPPLFRSKLQLHRTWLHSWNDRVDLEMIFEIGDLFISIEARKGYVQSGVTNITIKVNIINFIIFISYPKSIIIWMCEAIFRWAKSITKWCQVDTTGTGWSSGHPVSTTFWSSVDIFHIYSPVNQILNHHYVFACILTSTYIGIHIFVTPGQTTPWYPCQCFILSHNNALRSDHHGSSPECKIKKLTTIVLFVGIPFAILNFSAFLRIDLFAAQPTEYLHCIS